MAKMVGEKPSVVAVSLESEQPLSNEEKVGILFRVLAVRNNEDSKRRIEELPIDLLSSSTNEQQQTFLHVAAKTLLHEVVRALISRLSEAGKSLSPIDQDGNTPLHLVVKHSQTWILDEFLQSYALSTQDLEVVNNEGDTPLLSAIKLLKKELAEKLIQKASKLEGGIEGLSLSDQEGSTALHLVVKNKINFLAGQLTRLLADNQEAMGAVDLRGRTALHWAAEAGNTDMIYCLRMHVSKETRNIVDNEGNTAFMLAKGTPAEGLLPSDTRSGVS